MPINAKNLVVTNKDNAHLQPNQAKQKKLLDKSSKPNKPLDSARSKPVEKKKQTFQQVQTQTDKKEEVNEGGLFVRKKSKFLDDMLNSN